jgi:hypothetical protein
MKELRLPAMLALFVDLTELRPEKLLREQFKRGRPRFIASGPAVQIKRP